MPLRPAVRTGGPERGTAVPVQRQGPELTLASSADLPVRALAAVPLVPGGSVPPAGGPDAGVRPWTVAESDSPQAGPRTAPETFSLPQPSAGTLPLLGDRAPLGEQPVEPMSPAPGPPRRLGLGAPLPAPPPSVQRSASPPAPVRGRIGEPLREVLTTTAPPYEDTAPATEPPAVRPVPLREGPTTTAPPYEDKVSAAVQPVLPNALAPRTGDAVPAPAPVQRTAAGSELPVVRPVPLPPGPGVRGAVDPAIPAADGGVRADVADRAALVGERGLELRSALMPVPVQRDAAEPAASEPVVVPVRPLAPDRPKTVGIRPVPAPDARSAPAAPPVQRVAAGDPGAVAVAAGIGQRMPDGSVVFAPPAAPATHPTAPVPSATVQRSEDAHHTDPTDPPPPPPAPWPEPAPAPPPVGDAAAAAAATAPAPSSGGAESTDELVRRLIDPLSRVLRAELRLDRERAGLRLDNRY
ncbi:hypothetical protein [Kitasatospora cinereorecta]|uniref:hypothetical protein n=1 Tax=Kitasatospora cinereorecta TaxID=285560 RepID=UPI0031F9C2B3